MKKAITIGALILIILILFYIFVKTIQFLSPLLILIGLIIVCIGGLIFIIKSFL